MFSSLLLKNLRHRSRFGVYSSIARPFSYLSDIPLAPADPIIGLTDQFNQDTDTRKVSLGVGAYRDDDGKPYVLPSVVEAERRLLASKDNKEYAGIAGVKSFVDASLAFAYGTDCRALTQGRIAGVQTISGTGACRLAGEFFQKFKPDCPMYLPNPTWGNHIPIMKDAGLTVKRYAYYDPVTKALDYKNFLKDIDAAAEGSIFLLHACAHNPTGVDPSAAQWKSLSAAMKVKRHVPFFDCAYQGFASGDANVDALAIRTFVRDGHEVVLSQSYAKNFGLYGERIGALSVVTRDALVAEAVLSQLKVIIRPMYSNPPIHGARIVSTILSDPILSKQWYSECKAMADRILDMRQLLRTHLETISATATSSSSSSSSPTWNHITDQIGMFCYTGLTPTQVKAMITSRHIYLTSDGRISMAGVTTHNVKYIAASIAAVLSV